MPPTTLNSEEPVFSVASFVTEGFVTAGFVMASGQSCGEAPAPYWALALCHIAE